MKDLTPKQFMCAPFPGCPAVLRNGDEYYVIGKTIDPVDAGLSARVSPDETLISISAELVEQAIKSQFDE
ncbi:MAG: hypothetical protein AAFQ04_07960 [Pseudomonadota bacterium]